MNKKRIGIFDSGLGGLSVLRELLLREHSLEIHYSADLDYAPYGGLSSELISKRSFEQVKRLIERGCELIILACNTATAHSIDQLRKDFDIAFVGIEPYLNVAKKKDKNQRGLVLLTEATLNSKRFQLLRDKADSENRFDYLGCPGLAQTIESFLWKEQGLDEVRRQIEKNLSSLETQKDFQFLVLGCTHYPLVRSLISEVSGVSEVLSPEAFVVDQVERLLFFETQGPEKKEKSFLFSPKLGEGFHRVLWENLEQWPSL